MSEEEEQNRFSLRKLSIGLASVLVGVSIFGTSQQVKADTVANSQASTVTSNAQSNDTQENKNIAKSTFSSITPYNNAKSNLTQTQVEGKNEQKQVQTENGQQDSVSKTQEATDSNDSQKKDAESDIVRTSSLQKINNQSNTVVSAEAKANTPDSVAVKPNITPTETKKNATDSATLTVVKPQETKLAKSVDAKVLAESKVATDNQFNFDDWTTQIDNTYLNITGYKGDRSEQIVVPNGADFAKAGKNDKNLQVEIDSNTLSSLIVNGVAPKLSNTDGQKIVAKGNDWTNAFISRNLHDISGLANLDTSNVTDMGDMFNCNQISDLSPLANWNTSNVTDMGEMFDGNQISDLSPLANWNTSNVTSMNAMFAGNQISNLTPLANWKTDNVTDMSYMFAVNSDLIDLSPIANWNMSSVTNDESLFANDAKLDLTNINDTPLMKFFLKEPNALSTAIFITNNADLVKATTGQDLPDSTNTAKRTITFNIPNATPETIVQTINYKAITTVQVDYNSKEIVQTYPVKESDWQLDTSKHNDAIIVNGQIRFKSVKIPHINGYKAYIVPNKSNPALFTVSFVAVPTENKPSKPIEETPSKPSAPTDNSNNSAWTDLKHKVVNTLNQSDSGWTMPENNSTYTVEVPDDAIIDLSDLVIAEPVHAQTRAKITVTKRFKLSKKHVAKHLKHRKKAVKSFKKYRL